MAGGSGFAGKFVPVLISWNNTDFFRLGAVRAKSFDNATEVADSTADDSPGGYREVIETFITGTNNFDGIVKRDDRGNVLDRFDAFFHNPALENGADGQPLDVRCFYVRYQRPKTNGETRTYTAPVQLTNFSFGAPYDDVVTFTFETQTIGDVVVADA